MTLALSYRVPTVAAGACSVAPSRHGHRGRHISALSSRVQNGDRHRIGVQIKLRHRRTRNITTAQAAGPSDGVNVEVVSSDKVEETLEAQEAEVQKVELVVPTITKPGDLEELDEPAIFKQGWKQLEGVIGTIPYNENEDKPPTPKGSIVGAAALIAGSAIGGGILAVPAVTAPVGFVPSTLVMTCVWGFCCSQALLLAEVCLAIMKKKGLTTTSMLGMASTTLGRPVGIAVGVMYFLFSNALLVGQLSRGGELISSAAQYSALYPAAVIGMATVCFTLSLADGGRVGELVNRALTGLIIATFVVLVGYGAANMTWAPLVTTAKWSTAYTIVPYMLQVLNFMNMIPLVCSYLGGSRSRVRKAVVSGSLVPLVICVIWNAVIVGLTHNSGALALADPINVLLSSGTQWLSLAIYLFAACAVVTSILGTYLALEEFVTEALGKDDQPEPEGDACQIWDQTQLSGARRGILPRKWSLGTLTGAVADPEFQKRAVTFLPSAAVAALSPSAFYNAMNLSGTYFVPTIFCLAPPAMAWLVRYGRGPWPFQEQVWRGSQAQTRALLPGGQGILTGLALASISTMLFIGEFSLFGSFEHFVELINSFI
mmetsp:Transcript_38680/g.84131  ORF Transcript_38680/g.84131 Transcript_38680/m.84131 type:complete len:600 (-) Transcript_38680:418-2217(-)|eukprot:CAMPEP_0118935912 /NCGR_PEP_ID=MMETSP1169-20130426/15899_1 /TAXON_ID=36882 /ORGANISM="Pyramimonas obovata, Strain CCMP722" /LENGTH=599 /DNA_ID=CAMNT_0006878993 /DNA_START=269 /DNA_END=2068 /DNA_ORIENTATION=+